jgi:hypothetical protein
MEIDPMIVHGPSLALGFSIAIIGAHAARRLRPVGIEVGALAIEIAKMTRSAIELQREYLEDYLCEVEVRVTERAKARRTTRSEAHGAVPSESESVP